MNPTFDIVDAFLADELSEADKTQFLRRLQEEETFGREVKEYLHARQAIQAFAKAELRAQVQQAYQKDRRASNRNIGFWGVIGSIAAAIALIWLSSIWLQAPGQQAWDQETLLASYYQEQVPRYSRDQGPTDSLFSQGIQAYQQGETAAAIQKLTEALQQEGNTDESELHFFLGQIYLTEKFLEQAVEQFGQVTAGSLRSRTARWNTVLALLMLDQPAEAKQALQQMLQQSEMEYYHTKARELLKKLE